MSKVKRLLCLIIVVTFAAATVFAFSGCKPTASTTEATTAATTTAPTTTESPTKDFVQLKWYVCQEAQADHDEVMARVNEILKEKINASLDLQFLPWAAFEDKMALFFNSGEVFDLCYTCSWLKPLYSDVVSDGFLLQLDDLMAKYGPAFKEVPEFLWNAIKVNGKIYALPNYQVEFSQDAMAMRKDLLDKHNLDVSTLKQYKDLGQFFKVIKDNEPGIYPYVNQYVLCGYDLSWPKAYIDEGLPLMIDGDYKVSYYWDDPEWIDFYNTNHEWYNLEYIPHDPNILINAMPNIEAGKVFATENTYKPGTEADFKKAHGVEMVYFKYSEAILSQGMSTAALTGVSSTSKHPERAVMLLNLTMSDKELLNTIVYGIKDKHFKMAGDNRIEPQDAAKNYSMFAWQIGCQFLAYLLPGQPDTVWEETRKLNQESKPAVLLGFNVDKDPIKTENSAVGAVFKKYESVVWSSSMSLDEFAPQMKEEYMQAGLEQLIAGIQKQIDEWKAANNK